MLRRLDKLPVHSDVVMCATVCTESPCPLYDHTLLILLPVLQPLLLSQCYCCCVMDLLLHILLPCNMLCCHRIRFPHCAFMLQLISCYRCCWEAGHALHVLLYMSSSAAAMRDTSRLFVTHLFNLIECQPLQRILQQRHIHQRQQYLGLLYCNRPKALQRITKHLIIIPCPHL